MTTNNTMQNQKITLKGLVNSTIFIIAVVVFSIVAFKGCDAVLNTAAKVSMEIDSRKDSIRQSEKKDSLNAKLARDSLILRHRLVFSYEKNGFCVYESKGGDYDLIPKSRFGDCLKILPSGLARNFRLYPIPY